MGCDSSPLPTPVVKEVLEGWGAPQWQPPGGFLSAASPERGPGVGLCDAGPKGSSAYSVGGSRRHQPVPGEAEPPAGRA